MKHFNIVFWFVMFKLIWAFISDNFLQNYEKKFCGKLRLFWNALNKTPKSDLCQYFFFLNKI